MTTKRFLWRLTWTGFFLVGCGAEPGREAVVTRCGQGPAQVALGVEDPFEARPEHMFPVDQGLQGGHHVDISLRITGAMDPEHTDVRLSLLDDDGLLAEHRVDDWVLEFEDDGPPCEYLRARLVLMTPEDKLLPPDDVPVLLDRPLELTVHLSSPKGGFDSRFQVTLDRINYLE